MSILLLILAVAAPAAERTMTIDNRSNDVLRGVFLSSPSDPRWGPQLTDDNLRIGVRTKVTLPGPGCRWDVRILLGGRPAEQIFRNRDLCRQPIVIVDGRTLRFLRGSEPARWN